MSSSSELDATRYLAALKELLKERGVTYAELAKALHCSLPTVKRALNKPSLPLNRLMEFCEIAGIAFEDLHQRVERCRPKHYVFTDEQDQLFFERVELLDYLVELAREGTTPSDIAERHNLWYHVDAAYGGFFILCDALRRTFDGIGQADSVVMDPHKGLFLPYGCGAVLVKDRSLLGKAHYYQANYMQDVAVSEDEYSPADHSPELTRHYRGLRLWLPLKLFGLKPFRACLEEKLHLARYFHTQIQRLDGFEAGPEPDLSVVTYRYIPKKGDANEFNRRIIEEVHKDGRVFLSSTMLDGKFTLRLAVLAFRTHLDTINTALDVLEQAVKRIEASSG